jgi:methionine-rich copper-binding protein CopC
VARLSLTLVPTTRRLAGAVVAVAGAVLAVGVTATPAAAVTVDSAEPSAGSQLDEAPDEVRLEFDEFVGLTDVTISVSGPDGDATDGRPRVLGDTARQELQDDLPNGRYTVSWTVRSSGLVDGGSGSFAFRIGPPPPRDLPSPTGSAAAPPPSRPTDRTTPPTESAKPSATPTGTSSPTATKAGSRRGDPITAARPTADVPQPDVAGIRSRAAEWLPPPAFWWGLVVVAVIGGITWRRRRSHPPLGPTPPAPESAPEPHLVPAAGREPAPDTRVLS